MDGTVRVVTAVDLVRSYRDEPAPTALAYDSQLVRIWLPAFDREGPPGELRLVLSYAKDAPKPPVLVLRAPRGEPFPPFDALRAEAPLWVEGACRGRFDDGLDRGAPGYTFKVIVTDCRLVGPAGAPGAKP